MPPGVKGIVSVLQNEGDNFHIVHKPYLHHHLWVMFDNLSHLLAGENFVSTHQLDHQKDSPPLCIHNNLDDCNRLFPDVLDHNYCAAESAFQNWNHHSVLIH